MSKRKDTLNVKEQKVSNKRFKPILKIENAPPVHSVKDLIEIGRSIKFYKNIDSIMLWRITPYLEQLDKMIGMQSVKETIFYQVIYYLQKMHTRNQNEEYLHTIITGSPGSGKTTVARIIGKIYQSLGILSSHGSFKIAYRDDFIAEYLGQTAVKTRKLLKSCIGGVLFIDEVYSLAPGKKDRDSFSKEALDTLTAFLSEHKNDFCCIAAGYEEDINHCFFAMNQGLKRRFPWTHKIDEYSDNELTEIFLKMVCDMKWGTSVDKENISDIFKKNKKYFKNAGGDIETFLSKCKMMHAKRVFNKGIEHKFILTKKDLDDGIQHMIEHNKIVEETPPPMGMYT